MLKKFLPVLALSMCSSFAKASHCETVDGLWVENGQSILFYLTDQPRTQLGPNYTCKEVSRVRTCVDGRLSENTPTCSEFDSGGCVDSWLQQLSDFEFTFRTCRD